MYLHKLILNSRHPQVRRDLSSRYEMHRTLVGALAAEPDEPPPERYLWRLETSKEGVPVLLVQTPEPADWSRLQRLHRAHGSSGSYCETVIANKALKLDGVANGASLAFRLHACPTRMVDGKRRGLLSEEDQLGWLARVSEENGFRVVQCERARGYLDHPRKGDGTVVSMPVAEFNGSLGVVDAQRLESSVRGGLGRGKAFGLGLLSLARLH